MNDVVQVNVYLPRGNDFFVQEYYMECLASIANDISDMEFSSIIVGGDLNTDLGYLLGILCKSI